MSEMVLFRYLYSNGMGMRGSIWNTFANAACTGVFMAACRWNYLYDRRRDLRAEAADF